MLDQVVNIFFISSNPTTNKIPIPLTILGLISISISMPDRIHISNLQFLGLTYNCGGPIFKLRQGASIDRFVCRSDGRSVKTKILQLENDLSEQIVDMKVTQEHDLTIDK